MSPKARFSFSWGGVCWLRVVYPLCRVYLKVPCFVFL